MRTTAIADLWRRLEAWLKTNAPTVLATLQAGASPEEIATTEAFLGVAFPDDVRASYLLHDGQTDYADGLFYAREFLSLARIQIEWSWWKGLYDSGELRDYRSDAPPQVRDDWWNPQWIPLTHDGSGNHDCLDLAPTPQGKVGQIIDFYHDDASREVMAESFTVWLAKLVEGCENGTYVFSEEYGDLVEGDAL